MSESHLRETVGFLLGICAPLADVTPNGSDGLNGLIPVKGWESKLWAERKRKGGNSQVPVICQGSKFISYNPDPFEIKSDGQYSFATTELQF